MTDLQLQVQIPFSNISVAKGSCPEKGSFQKVDFIESKGIRDEIRA